MEISNSSLLRNVTFHSFKRGIKVLLQRTRLFKFEWRMKQGGGMRVVDQTTPFYFNLIRLYPSCTASCELSRFPRLRECFDILLTP